MMNQWEEKNKGVWIKKKVKEIREVRLKNNKKEGINSKN